MLMGGGQTLRIAFFFFTKWNMVAAHIQNNLLGQHRHLHPVHKKAEKGKLTTITHVSIMARNVYPDL